MAETDVVVVGAGAGGLAAAWRLVSQGVRVTLLEAGHQWEPQRDYPQTSSDFESRRFPYDPERDEGGRARYGFGRAQEVSTEWDTYRSWDRVRGRTVPGNRRHYQAYHHVRGVGGSTLHFQGEAHRYHPDSLRTESLFGAGADWPISYDELERYYDIAEQQIGVAGPAENPWRPRRTPPPLPAHAVSYASRRLSSAFAAVGGTLLPNSLAILSTSHDGRPPCNYCNSCTEGCPLGDTGSADVVFLPPALATGRLDLRTEAQVLRVEVGGDGRVSGVVYRAADGSDQRVQARFVVLGAGAIETPRLLLLSTSSGFPNGVANDHGQVGLNLTELLAWSSVAFLDDRVDAHRGVPIDATAWDFAVPRRREDGTVGGFRVSTAHGALGLRGPIAYAQRLVSGAGRSLQQRIRDVFGHAIGLLAVGDWLPNRDTFVDLDPSLRDASGLPVARITSHLGANERGLLKSMAATMRGILAAARVVEIVEENSALDLFSSTHVLGTCRMGRNPDRSVADADGFSHAVPNLGFADGSLVPSSGSGDSPALTITALALRTADRLIARAR